MSEGKGLVDELHHLHGRLVAALETVLDGGGALSLLLVGVLGHTEGGGDDVERIGVAVHHVEQTGLELVALGLDLGGVLGVLGVLLAALGQTADHGGQRGADGAVERGAGAAARRGRVRGNDVGKAGNGQFSKFHRIQCPSLWHFAPAGAKQSGIVAEGARARP